MWADTRPASECLPGDRALSLAGPDAPYTGRNDRCRIGRDTDHRHAQGATGHAADARPAWGCDARCNALLWGSRRDGRCATAGRRPAPTADTTDTGRLAVARVPAGACTGA